MTPYTRPRSRDRASRRGASARSGGLGTPVDCAGLRSRVAWRARRCCGWSPAGALDLFAVDAGQQGHWHFLGRLEAGALLLGPVAGPAAHPGRPAAAGLRGAPHRLRELYRAARTTPHDRGRLRRVRQRPQYVPPTTSPAGVRPRARASAAACRILFQAPMADRAGRRRPRPTTTCSGCRCRRAACSTARLQRRGGRPTC